MPARRDPLIAPRFTVKFGDKIAGSFRECTVVSAEHEVAEYKFADDKGAPGYFAVPGRMKFGRITLKRQIDQTLAQLFWVGSIFGSGGKFIVLNHRPNAVSTQDNDVVRHQGN